MKTHAFTLIEVLIVVLIVGILAAIALPQYKYVVLKSRFMDMKNSLHTIANAEESYFLANGKYTQNRDDLDINFPLSETLVNKYQIQVSDNIKCGIEGAIDGYHLMYCTLLKQQIYLFYRPSKHQYICCNYKLSNLYNDEFCKKEVNNTVQSNVYSNSGRRCYPEL